MHACMRAIALIQTPNYHKGFREKMHRQRTCLSMFDIKISGEGIRHVVRK
jgi:hypothetical protein